MFLRWMGRPVRLYTVDQPGGGAVATPPTPVAPTAAATDPAPAPQQPQTNDGLLGSLLMMQQRDDRIRELEGQLRTLQAAQPAADAVVLTAEQAAAWRAYQELGSAEELRAARQQAEQAQREQRIAAAAQAAGYNAAALGPLAADLDVQIREETTNGTTARRAVVVVDGAEQPIADYAAAHWQAFLPSLTAQQPQQQQATTFIRQQAAGSAPQVSMAQQYIDRVYGPHAGKE